jgi:hypothetical protein
MRCPQGEKCCFDVFPKFDEYGRLPFDDEKARLDNFVIQMRERNARGALVVFGENPAERRKMLQRAERARSYAVKVLGLEPMRMLVIDGGYRNQSVTVLHLYAIAGFASQMIFFPEKDPVR